MKKRIVEILIGLTIFVIAGCGTTQNQNTSSTPAELIPPELTVAAASDLARAFTEVGAAFEDKYDCSVVFSFGSTGLLAEQIANGAPFDVFAAANESFIDDLNSEGHVVSDTIQLYAMGRIGIVTMKDRDVEATTFEDLLSSEVRIVSIANPDHAPYGLAAKQALITAGYWDVLEPKLAYGRNISDALEYVVTGNADAGIIALSLKDDTHDFTLLDDNLHEPLRQAAAVVSASEHQELARVFISFVLSEEGQEIMNRYGFILPE